MNLKIFLEYTSTTYSADVRTYNVTLNAISFNQYRNEGEAITYPITYDELHIARNKCYSCLLKQLYKTIIDNKYKNATV